MTIDLLYEDEDILAVNKPEGLASVPERRRLAEDLVTQLMAQEGRRLWVVHRLDKVVSGLILFAKHAQAHRYLNEQFQQRRVDKTYQALVYGCPDPPEGMIDDPLFQFGSGRMGVDSKRGKKSRTNYKVIEANTDFSIVEVKPVTGRRHQIRVHLYSIGHPIVGDPCYGDLDKQTAYARLLLHAYEISLRGLSGQYLTITCPLPESFSTLRSQLM